MIRHIVHFTVKEPIEENFDRVYNGLKILETIPCDGFVQVRKNTKIDQIGNEVDVVVYGEFKSIAALKAYKNHPTYEESIRQVRPYRDMRMASDTDIDA